MAEDSRIRIKETKMKTRRKRKEEVGKRERAESCNSRGPGWGMILEAGELTGRRGVQLGLRKNLYSVKVQLGFLIFP